MPEAPEEQRLGPDPSARPRGLWRMLRALWVVPAVCLVLMLVCPLFCLVSLLTLRFRVRSYMHLFARFAGRTILWLLGIELRVKGREHIEGRKARLLVLNHTSQLDLFIFAATMPRAGTVLAKRELAWVPFIGWFLVAARTIFIHRTKSASARRTLDDAARIMVEERATILIAPEGTRSRSGELGPFKMGLFHLALASRAPIVPVIVKGAKLCQPMGRYVPDPGIVQMEFLPEISTAEYSSDDLKSQRDALRALFLERLGS